MQYPKYIKSLHDLKDHGLQKFLQEKRERFPENDFSEKPERLIDIKTIPPLETSLESIIDALCHPDVVNKAAELLLNNTQK